MSNTKMTMDLEIEIQDEAPEKAYSRDSWPKSNSTRVVWCKSDDTIYFILDDYNVTTLYNPKAFGLREAKPALEGSTQALLEAIAVMAHNKRLGT